jgi:hypothetical protein
MRASKSLTNTVCMACPACSGSTRMYRYRWSASSHTASMSFGRNDGGPPRSLVPDRTRGVVANGDAREQIYGDEVMLIRSATLLRHPAHAGTDGYQLSPCRRQRLGLAAGRVRPHRLQQRVSTGGITQVSGQRLGVTRTKGYGVRDRIGQNREPSPRWKRWSRRSSCSMVRRPQGSRR